MGMWILILPGATEAVNVITSVKVSVDLVVVLVVVTCRGSVVDVVVVVACVFGTDSVVKAVS